MKNRRKARFRLLLVSVIFVFIIIFAIFIGAQIFRNNQNSKIKKVLGIDVSAHQGEINWKEVEKQGVYFAYIKATESDNFTDSQFKRNWEEIDSTILKKGAYLFYDFNKDGNLMADYFIKVVPKEHNTLPPAIDVELDSESNKNTPNKRSVLNNIDKIIKKFRENYNQDPIIYTNMNTYETYFKDQDLENIKFWICDLNNSYPEIDKSKWSFWQFSWRGMLNGMDSDEIFVDYDLYNGTLNDFYNEYNKSFLETLF